MFITELCTIKFEASTGRKAVKSKANLYLKESYNITPYTVIDPYSFELRDKNTY